MPNIANQAPTPAPLYVLRSRLARQLAWRSVAGLLTLCVALFGIGVASALAFVKVWGGIQAGEPLPTAFFSLLGVALALAAGLLADVLFSAPPQPRGVRLPRAAAADFYQLLDHLAACLHIRPIRHVLITGDMNAQIVQRPAWGLCGPLRTRLLLGLPLIHSLSAPQLAAVLAHELAHVAAQRQGWSGRGAHMRAWWARTLDRAASRSPYVEAWVDQHFGSFCERMLKLARAEELEADALAACLVGKELMGEALIEVSLKARFLENDYWPRMQSRAAIRPYREMGFGFEAGFVRAEPTQDAWLYEGEDAGSARRRHSFHPSLRTRLRALRTPLRQPSQVHPPASQRYFAPLLPALASAFDREWAEEARPRGARQA